MDEHRVLTEVLNAIPRREVSRKAVLDLIYKRQVILKSHLIGLSGHDGVGKSTLARELVSAMGTMNDGLMDADRAVVVPLADGVRREVAAATGLPLALLYEKPTPPYIRSLLRGWGEMRRVQDKDYWIRLWREEAFPHLAHGRVVIVDDVRHPNEAAVMMNNGILVTLERQSTEPMDVTVDSPEIIKGPYLVRDYTRGPGRNVLHFNVSEGDT